MRRVAVLLSVLLLWAGPSAAGGERLALVIGNGGYQALKPLSNPSRDAGAIAARLGKLGFTLIGGDGRPTKGAVLNLDEDAFSKVVRAFAKRAKGAEIALIYYAGHGMQIEGVPYLLPVDVPRDDLALLQRNSIALDSILKRLDGKAELTVAVFDACREIPELDEAVAEATRDSGYGASAYRGLGRVQNRGRSRIVAYSGGAGQLVADGRGGHSPYTELLLAQLDKSDPVEAVFQRVAWQFGHRHGGQNPEVVIQGVEPGRYYFVPPGVVPPPMQRPPSAVSPPPAQPSPEALERALDLTRDERRAVQQALNTLGFAVGSADGVWGRNTRRGIELWQVAAGKTASGFLDADGYKALLAEAAGSAPLDGPGWIVQVDSVASAAKAASHEKKLRDSGFPAFIEKASIAGRIWYRVRVGPEREREAANELNNKLKRRGYPQAFVMRYL